jgi:hypothetical protein
MYSYYISFFNYNFIGFFQIQFIVFFRRLQFISDILLLTFIVIICGFHVNFNIMIISVQWRIRIFLSRSTIDNSQFISFIIDINRYSIIIMFFADFRYNMIIYFKTIDNLKDHHIIFMDAIKKKKNTLWWYHSGIPVYTVRTIFCVSLLSVFQCRRGVFSWRCLAIMFDFLFNSGSLLCIDTE